ncbi:MAG: hypothetical protein Q9162_005493 [Coniocarpon cinnabarinum]
MTRSTNNQADKDQYLKSVDGALSLQRRFQNEANIDLISRVAFKISTTTSLPVRMARENGRDYFAGQLRYVENYIAIHADYGAFDGPGWEIGKVLSQVTWNVLLQQVEGGDTIIYDRQWRGREDDEKFKRAKPSFAYSPVGLQGHTFKAMGAVEGDLTFFNSRNFHEVKPCEKRAGMRTAARITMSSFIGYLPGDGVSGPCLIMWS